MRYHFLSKLIHWSSALIIGGLLFLGFYMSSLEFSDFKLQLYLWHKSFGLLILVLLFLRVLFLVLFKKPKPIESHKKWERVLSRAVHIFLYGALLLMSLSGWVMSSAGDYTVQFFGLHMPDFVFKNESLFENSKTFHEIWAFLLIAVIGLHALGALKHHFIDQDVTLKRMICDSFGLKGGIVLLVFLVGMAVLLLLLIRSDLPVVKQVVAPVALDERAVVSASAPEWVIDLPASAIVFTATQYGQEFEGRFEDFGGQIFFDPEDLGNSKVRIEVDIASLKTGSSDRDAQALAGGWFDAARYPKAVFEAARFSRVGSYYVAHGVLNVRDVKMDFDLSFRLNIDDNQAVMMSEFTVERLDYGVGIGQSEQVVSYKVAFKINLTAHRK